MSIVRSVAANSAVRDTAADGGAPQRRRVIHVNSLRPVDMLEGGLRHGLFVTETESRSVDAPQIIPRSTNPTDDCTFHRILVWTALCAHVALYATSSPYLTNQRPISRDTITGPGRETPPSRPPGSQVSPFKVTNARATGPALSPDFIHRMATKRLGTATVRERTRAARVSERAPDDPLSAGLDTAWKKSAC